MSDKFKQFKNELIDLLAKYDVELWANTSYEIEACEYKGPTIGILEDGINKNTPKEDI